MERTLKELYNSGNLEELEKRVKSRYYELRSAPVDEDKIEAFENKIQSLFERHINESVKRCRQIKETLKEGEYLEFDCEMTLGDNPSCGEDWKYTYCPDLKHIYLPAHIFSFYGGRDDSCETDWHEELVLHDVFYHQGRSVHYGIHHFIDNYIPLCDLVGVQSFDFKITISIKETEGIED